MAAPKYRAEGALFIGRRLIEPGETFSSDLPPGKKWAPLNDEARAAVLKRDGKAPEAPMDFKQDPQPGPVAIPENWIDLPDAEKRALARDLGAPRNVNGTAAMTVIENELKRRAAAAQGEA